MLETIKNPATKSAVKTRIAVFAFADAGNYSRYMADDSVKAVQDWAQLRKDVLLAGLSDVSGHLVSVAGDAILVEFASTTAAVQWALNVQAAIRAQPPQDKKMQIRIGINVDDVVDDGETLQSDGVVIGSRIHQLATPGEIVVTQLARDIVRGRMNASFRDMGTPPLKNVDRPVRVFVVSEKAPTEQLVRPHASWSSRPTLAVLPFRDFRRQPGRPLFRRRDHRRYHHRRLAQPGDVRGCPQLDPAVFRQNEIA